MKKAGPVLNAAMTRPASPGPMRRAALKDALFRPTALLSESRGTISETKVWRVGLSSAVATPWANARRYMLPELDGAGDHENAGEQ